MLCHELLFPIVCLGGALENSSVSLYGSQKGTYYKYLRGPLHYNPVTVCSVLMG